MRGDRLGAGHADKASHPYVPAADRALQRHGFGLALGMDITDLQRFLGHESISTTRLYAETTAATLQRRFDQLTDSAAHTLVANIRRAAR